MASTRISDAEAERTENAYGDEHIASVVAVTLSLEIHTSYERATVRMYAFSPEVVSTPVSILNARE